MDYYTRDIINKLTDEIRSTFKIPLPVDDLSNFVKSIGGMITESDLKSRAYEGRTAIKSTKYAFEIFIPENQHPDRKKFLIARELGYLFLHMGYLIDESMWKECQNVDFYKSESSEEESQANEFAAALIMPRKEYKRVMDRYTDARYVNTRYIAEYFGVSIQAASNRGKLLGYLSW